MINKHIGIKDCWCKNEYSFLLFFLKWGAHAPVAPPPPGYGLDVVHHLVTNFNIGVQLTKEQDIKYKKV